MHFFFAESMDGQPSVFQHFVKEESESEEEIQTEVHPTQCPESSFSGEQNPVRYSANVF
jgi:hypothetical protein